MPTYHSPSSSRSPSPSRSFTPSPTRPRRGSRSDNRSRSRRRRSPSPSSSLSRSPSRSPSRSASLSRSSTRTRSSKPKFPDDGLSEEKSENIIKTSLVFLGSVAAATYAAHKFWPKGITYGEKEEWEIEKAAKKEAKKAKKALEGKDDGGSDGGRDGSYAESSGSSGRGDRDRRGGDRDRRGDREERRAGYRAAAAAAAGGTVDERNSGRGGVSAGGGYYVREDVVVRDRPVDGRSRSRLRESERGGPGADDGYRGARRDRHDGADPAAVGLAAVGPAAVVERRASTRRETNYYPPSPNRLAIERGGSVSGPTRGPARDRSRPPTYEDDQPEVVFVRREPAGSGARYSVETGRPRSRYDDDAYYR